MQSVHADFALESGRIESRRAAIARCSPSIATTSKRHGGVRAVAAQIVLRREHEAGAAWLALTLAAAPPWPRLRGARTSTNTSVPSRSRRIRSTSPPRARGPARDPIIALHEREPLAQRDGPARAPRRIAHALVAPSSHRHARDHTPRLVAAPGRRRAAGRQHYPAGALYVVATPIGNLADLTLRAIHVLGAGRCDRLRRHAPQRAAAAPARHRSKPLLAVHEHNERDAAAGVLARLARGERVAYVSDAGTPAISDPGAALVAAAQRRPATACVPIPGASSAVAALSVAGDAVVGAVRLRRLPAGAGGERTRAAARRSPRSRDDPGAVRSAAPHRGAGRRHWPRPAATRTVTLCRELTKQFETCHHAAGRGAAGLAGGRPEPRARRVRARGACARGGR